MKSIGINQLNSLVEKDNGNDGYRSVDLVFRTFNETAKSGGKLKTYKNCEFMSLSKKELSKQRNPLHAYNRTRNVKLSTGDIKKVHIDFIISVNGIKITL